MRKRLQLGAIAIQKMKDPGRYPDGLGLYLQVSQSGTKSWIFRFMLNSRSSTGKKLSREMGLGPYPIVSLAEAREKAFECRRHLAAGNDPLAAKEQFKAQKRIEGAKGVSFDECAEAFIRSHAAKWTNPKHREQWENTLKEYVSPTFGKLSVQAVDTGLVIKALDPIWRNKTETASRIRGRIEAILSYAKAREWRMGENPARWRGHLDQLLPRPNEVAVKGHHAALPYKEVGTFMRDLRSEAGIAPLALQFAIYTVGRTGEVIGAEWDEFDLHSGLWTVPAIRMKHGKIHRIPLSDCALTIVRNLSSISFGRYIFPGARPKKPLSNMALLQVLKKRMKLKITAHGFRSTFRDWAAECTDFPSEVIEMALAHTISNKVEAAYRRGDLLEKRRELMNRWATFSNQIVPGNDHRSFASKETPAISQFQ